MKSRMLTPLRRALFALAIAAIVYASAPSPASHADALSATPATAYGLSSGDVVNITVQGHDELKETATILPDGTFTYPIVGTVQALGLTVSQLTDKLTQGLSNQINQPQVTVTVQQAFPPQVSIIGLVKTPGQYPYKAGMHLLDAVAAAGGPLQDLVQTSVTLVSVGKASSTTIAGTELSDVNSAADNATLMPGDVLLVQQANPSSAEIDVSGEVLHPGFFAGSEGGVTVESLIDEAGGPVADAALAHVQLTHAGAVRLLDLNQSGYLPSSDASVLVYPGDAIDVPVNQAKIAVLGEVHNPGAFLIPDGQTLSVTSAIALAGGTTSDADKMRADILSTGPNGKPTAVPVNVASMLRADPHSPNLMLQPGDILYIPTHSDRGANSANVVGIIPGLSYLLR
jgi:polysaccharide export outer membrane protein